MVVRLQQYNIEYVPKRVVKWQIHVGFFAAHPVSQYLVPDDSPLTIDSQKKK